MLVVPLSPPAHAVCISPCVDVGVVQPPSPPYTIYAGVVVDLPTNVFIITQIFGFFTGSITASVSSGGPSVSVNPDTFTQSGPFCAIVPPACTFSSTVTVDTSGVTPGAYTITITATVGSQSGSVDVPINVVDFTMGPSAPTTVTCDVGASCTTPITVTPLGGIPPGGSVTFSIVSTTGITCNDQTSDLLGGYGTNIFACSASATGNYGVVVTGIAQLSNPFSGTEHSTALITYQVSDFTISPSSPTSMTCNLGASCTNTISVGSLNGFNGVVTLTANPSSGLTASLSAGSVTGSGSVTLTTSATIPGDYTVTVTGTDGTLSRTTATISIHVLLLTLTPNSGPSGTPVTVTGLGFTPSSQVTVNFGTTTVFTGTTTSTGAFSGTFTVPNSAGCTTSRVTATDQNGLSATVAFSTLPSVTIDGIPMKAFTLGIRLSLFAVTTGGIGPFTFSWTENGARLATTQSISDAPPLGDTIYSVTATDAHGCQASASGTAHVFDYTVSLSPTDIVTLRQSSSSYTISVGLVAGSTTTGLPSQAAFVGFSQLPSDAMTTTTVPSPLNFPQSPFFPSTTTIGLQTGPTSLGDFTVTALVGLISPDNTCCYDPRSGSAVLHIFDYSVSLSPSQQTVPPATTTSYTVGVALASGSTSVVPSGVSLSIAGLPPGTTTNLPPFLPFGSSASLTVHTGTTLGVFPFYVLGSTSLGVRTGTATLQIISITISGITGSSVTTDSSGDTAVTLTGSSGGVVGSVIFPPGTTFPTNTLTGVYTTNGANTLLQVSGASVPYPPGKSISILNNAGVSNVCIVDSPQAGASLQTAVCGATNLSSSQVILPCDGSSHTYSPFPSGPTTRTYTCTPVISLNGLKYLYVSGLAFSTTIIDGTPPILSLPSDITTLLTGSSGAIVTFTVSATDDLDPSPVVACSAQSGAIFPIGTTIVTCTATDASGNVANGAFRVSVLYKFGGFLQPLQSGGSYQAGRGIPVKFQLTDANGNFVTTAVAQIHVDGTPGVPSGSSNSGNYFRYDATSNEYIFNLSTNGLSVGQHTIAVALDDGSSYPIIINLT